MSGEVVVVTGTRVRHYYVPPENTGSDAPVEGDTAVLEPSEGSPPGVGDPGAGYHVYEIIDLGIKLRVPIDEWNALTPAQRNALFFVLENYHLSPNLIAALQHLKSEGIDSIMIRVGPHGWNFDGTPYNFRTEPPALAAISAHSLNPDGTEL